MQNKFVGLTEGFCFTEINGLRRLCKNERISIRQMPSVIDLYKYGIRENPWDKLNVSELSTAYVDFKRRIKGQDCAIVKTLDVVKRAVTGMSGFHHSSHTKPKGTLFFADPTGTGKTETTKTLAEKLIVDESCCIRFDMSEYGERQSDQKLLGAPPGYVGYEAGGQLTNAVKENPFSILLFDEIEKAHPSIFDIFLQILEDGHMTDGQGNTVYFSECIIILLSCLSSSLLCCSGSCIQATLRQRALSVTLSVELYWLHST
ncbi:MAG: AAA family ATPase [Clostridiales bacterium]|nr:AAA family ATPase [Clostridiales bacterium]